MLQKPRPSARPAVERRQALWPWLLMPLAALAMFFALRTVRHSTESGQLGQGTEVPGDTSAQ